MSYNMKEREGDNLGDFEIIDILKEREGDNLGDGKFSGFQEMGISLNEVFPFLSGDGKFSGFPIYGKLKMTASIRKSRRTISGTHENGASGFCLRTGVFYLLREIMLI